MGGNPISAGLQSSMGQLPMRSMAINQVQMSSSVVLASGIDSSSAVQITETRLADLLDSTLWNRRPALSSERIVCALVQQIFLGIREYFLASA